MGSQGLGRQTERRAGAWTPFSAVRLGPGSHPQVPVFQANNDILAFLSGMPVTRNTKYLDLKNSVSQDHPQRALVPLSFCWAYPSRPPARGP